MVVDERSESNIWWGKESPNKPLTPESFNKNRDIAQNFIQGSPHVFVQDGFINWDPKVRTLISEQSDMLPTAAKPCPAPF